MPGSLPTMGSLLKLFLPLCGFRPTHSVLPRVVISTCNHHRYVHFLNPVDTSYLQIQTHTSDFFLCGVRVCGVCTHKSKADGRNHPPLLIHLIQGLSRKKKFRACQYGFGDPMFLPSEDYHIHQTFMWVSGDACLVSTKTPGPSPQPSISSLG